jgi:hypothetical protein
MAVGAIVNWYFSRKYYIQAGKELTAEAAELRKLTILILRGLEAAGLVEYNKDGSGNPTGIVFKMTGGGTLTPSGALETELIPGQGDLVKTKGGDNARLTEEASVTKLDS